MRNAPVTLGPTPKVAARAGTKIKEAKASPVPKASDPELLLVLDMASCLLFMMHLVEMG